MSVNVAGMRIECASGLGQFNKNSPARYYALIFIDAGKDFNVLPIGGTNFNQLFFK